MEYQFKKSDLLTALSELRGFTSKESTRYYLGGINLFREGDLMRFTATDGHKLALKKIKIQGCEKDSDAVDVIIPADGVGIFIEALKKSKSIDDDMAVTLNIQNNEISLSTGDYSVTSKLIDGTFPDITRVFPSSEPMFKYGMNELQVAAAAKVFKGRNAVISAEYFGEGQPHKFVDGDLQILLMPTRI